MEIEDIQKIDFQDGKRRVLILGNGVSRKHYSDVYKIWKTEIWGCNWVYKEYIDKTIPRLDLLIGDYVCLKVAHQYRRKELKGVQFIGKSQNSINLEGVTYPKGNKNRFSDSGSTITVHALESGYDEIYLLGFDLGGRDIYQKRHHLRNKKTWIKSWRKINSLYKMDKVYFIGFDHKPYIQSNLPEDHYAQKYMRGHDHLEDYYTKPVIILTEEEKEKLKNQKNIKKSDSVLILGNGKSRTDPKVLRFVRGWQNEIWGCNEIYKEYKQLPRLDRIGAKYSWVLDGAIKNNTNSFDVYVYDVGTDYQKEHIKYFQDNRNYLTGPQLILQAIYENYAHIYIAGFDFGGQDVYNRKTASKNKNIMISEMKSIIEQYDLHRFNFISGIPKILL